MSRVKELLGGQSVFGAAIFEILGTGTKIKTKLIKVLIF